MVHVLVIGLTTCLLAARSGPAQGLGIRGGVVLCPDNGSSGNFLSKPCERSVVSERMFLTDPVSLVAGPQLQGSLGSIGLRSMPPHC